MIIQEVSSCCCACNDDNQITMMMLSWKSPRCRYSPYYKGYTTNHLGPIDFSRKSIPP